MLVGTDVRRWCVRARAYREASEHSRVFPRNRRFCLCLLVELGSCLYLERFQISDKATTVSRRERERDEPDDLKWLWFLFQIGTACTESSALVTVAVQWLHDMPSTFSRMMDVGGGCDEA